MPVAIDTLKMETPTGITVGHTVLRHAEPASDKLLVILPGHGYTSEHPALYFLRMAAAEGGYDVLSVQYSFHVDPEPPADYMDGAALVAEIEAAVKTFDMDRYTALVIAGKSLGTPPAVIVAKDHIAAHAHKRTRLILMTPIGDSIKRSTGIPTLAQIGTGDGRYDAGQIAAANARPEMDYRVYDDLGHGLNRRGDWAASIDSLKQITGDCMAFLSR